ncbi:hypothetical protein Pcinc_033170 [Petrolisthes cinctipes]|uniref:Uncharacterized protein n=1 Tax=Petrolisthes cinctipes TaxID=88211 RepID=A0AAE1ESU1_PETCI|nr:hypothetical protein Pcinc_033170 [Petrolisthes cinctipes]
MDKNATPDQPPAQKPQKIIIYHQNHFHDRYQEECHALKSIINDFRIYCKPILTRSLLMRNSTAPVIPSEATTNVVYNFSCQEDRCDSSNSYIGRISTTLRRRMQSHRNQGSIFQHFTETHIMKPRLEKLLDQTEILHKENYFRMLQISKAVSIT